MMDAVESIESIMMSGYRQMGDGGVFPDVRVDYNLALLCPPIQCGACALFPGDGLKCPATLDTVSRKVGACKKYE